MMNHSADHPARFVTIANGNPGLLLVHVGTGHIYVMDRITGQGSGPLSYGEVSLAILTDAAVPFDKIQSPAWLQAQGWTEYPEDEQ